MSLSEPYLAQSIFGPGRLARHFRRLARTQKLAFTPPPESKDPATFLHYLERLASLNGITTLVIKETFRQEQEWDNVEVLNWIASGPRPIQGITRHPYDAAVSTLRFCRWWRGIVGRLVRIWIPRLPLFANDTILMKYFAANWSSFVRWSREKGIAVTRYEDLVLDSEATIKQICINTGMTFHSGMTDPQAPRVAFGGIGDPEVVNRKPRPIHGRSVGRKKELAPDLLKIVQSVCGETARELGYEL